MSGHTPGRGWAADVMKMSKRSWAALNDGDPITIVRRGCDVIAVVWARDDEDAHQFARLIAAAPEMYEALTEVRRWLMDPFEAKDADDENLHPAFRKALKATIAALAEASGRPE